MLISTALLLDSNIRNSVCSAAKFPCRRVVEGSKVIIHISFLFQLFLPFLSNVKNVSVCDNFSAPYIKRDVTKRDRERLDGVEMDYLRRGCRISRIEHIRNI
jgi:hypothetical protein